MTSFEFSLYHVLKLEGGYVNNPQDRGGPTNFGITLETLRAYRGVESLPPSEVEALTVDEAKKIYELKYWNVMQLDRVQSKDVALILFATGVHMGPQAAVKLLQNVLNRNFNEKLFPDGVLGNKTDVAISTAPKARLCRDLLRAVQIRYADICLSDPSQLVFLRGWLHRTFALQDALS